MSESDMAGRLSGAPRTDPRAFDRLCEEAAAEMIDAGTVPDFTVSSADFAADALLICADRYWRRRFLAEPGLGTAVRCAVWLAEHVEPEHRRAVEEKWALGYAFVTADTVDSDTAVEAVAGQIEQLGERAPDVAFFATAYHGGKLRTNFSFSALYRLLTHGRLARATGHRRSEPVLTALRALAAYGDRTRASDHALGLMREAWEHPGRGRAATDICLNGLANSRPFPRQGEILVEHARTALTEYPGDHGMYYWLAIGHQFRGRYEEAGAAIDEALRLLPAHGSRGSHGLLLEQYRQRRASVHDAQHRARRRLDGATPGTAVLAAAAGAAAAVAGTVVVLRLLSGSRGGSSPRCGR